jgi:KaiC/GvpD/RAD55 family RecA-like ATPase
MSPIRLPERPTVDDLEGVPGAIPPKPVGPPKPILIPLDQVEQRPLAWLWSGVVPLGKLTLIAGEPSVGKSLVTLDLAARVTTGSPFPGSSAATSPGGVILLGEEDGLGDTVRPRLEAARANLGLINALQAMRQNYLVRHPPWSEFEHLSPHEEPLDLRRNMRVVTEAIDSVANCRLVVLDPLSAYLSPGASGMQARRVLTKLAEVAAKRQVAVVVVTHFTKTAGDPLMYRPLGGLSGLAVARSAWVIVREQGSPRRWLLPLKQNLRESTGGLAFQVVAEPNGEARVQWEEPSVGPPPEGKLVPDRLAALPSDVVQSELAALGAGRAPDGKLDAIQHLTALLAQHGGQITVRKLMRASKQYKSTGEAEAALTELVAAGLAKRRRLSSGKRGGRPIEVFEAPEELRGQGPGTRDSHKLAASAEQLSNDALDSP